LRRTEGWAVDCAVMASVEVLSARVRFEKVAEEVWD